jgi:hypothetical protein
MVSGTNDKYLRADVAIPTAYEIAEPLLVWNKLFPGVQEESNSFMYAYDSSGKASDTKKQKPAPFTDGALFPEIDRSRKSYTSALTNSSGFSMRLPREVVRRTGGASELLDAYETAGYWLANYINDTIQTDICAGATTSFTKFSVGTAWSETGATPVQDIMNLAEDMDREGYPFRLTDLFVEKTNWYELKDYLTSVDVSDLKATRAYGLPEVKGDEAYIPITDTRVHKLYSGLDHSYVLGIDATPSQRVAEIHYFNDEKYSIPNIRYQTIRNGQKVTETVPNFGLHFKQYEEDNSHDTILQFWCEFKAVVKKPYGVLYGSGI